MTDPATAVPAPDGATRLFLVFGDPIAQVKAPGGLSRAFAARGRNALLLPAQVPAGASLDAFLRGADAVRNLDGMVATVPHKFAAFRHCATATERARFLQSANVLRRNADGTWHGDMTDGLGLLGGLHAAGFDPAGCRALLVGAGGAGSAIALALVEAGVSSLALHDAQPTRRDELLRKLEAAGQAELRAGSADPAGFDLVVNATPAGMRPEDQPPVLLDRLDRRMFVADVITAPEETPLLGAARALGCGTQTGVGMFLAQVEVITDFLLGT
jgi:shikimate dehydrogenase